MVHTSMPHPHATHTHTHTYIHPSLTQYTSQSTHLSPCIHMHLHMRTHHTCATAHPCMHPHPHIRFTCPLHTRTTAQRTPPQPSPSAHAPVIVPSLSLLKASKQTTYDHMHTRTCRWTRPSSPLCPHCWCPVVSVLTCARWPRLGKEPMGKPSSTTSEWRRSFWPQCH